jgi:hypothetical protein
VNSDVNRRWVDHAGYFGPNRRLCDKGMRLRERRRDDLSGPSPSLNVALRKLKLQVFDASPGRNAGAFADRTLATAMLAADNDALEVEARLENLARRILANPERDWRSTIYQELDAAGIETYDLH